MNLIGRIPVQPAASPLILPDAVSTVGQPCQTPDDFHPGMRSTRCRDRGHGAPPLVPHARGDGRASGWPTAPGNGKWLWMEDLSI